MFLKFLSSSIPWYFFFTGLMITIEMLSADEVFIAPGPQTATVIQTLREVIDGTLKHDAHVPNFMAEGRTRSVSIPWPEGPDNKAKNTREWFTFKLVHRGNLRRYEQEHHASSEAEITTAYRLMNADGLYKLDGHMMYISPHTGDDENSWADLDGSMLAMSEVFDGQGYFPVVTTCRNLIAQLEGKVKDNVWNPDLRFLRCSRTGSLIKVEKLEGVAIPEGKGGYTFSFTVDTEQGFRVVASDRHAGGEGRGLDYSDATMFEIEKHGDGIFFPMHGIQMIRSRGTVAVNEKNASIGKREFIIDQLKVDKFEYDDALFETSSLPLTDSTHVEDRRVTPPLEYTWPIRK